MVCRNSRVPWGTSAGMFSIALEICLTYVVGKGMRSDPVKTFGEHLANEVVEQANG